ncbi:DNA-directed RNA polymerase subunit beta [Sporolactobacillus terrae]|uniref:DNA-directed RNA polymerase subunit beta n=1 Tax=Sporolactobacillus terrae TaxID=269673 RepID=A0ABX5Q4H4_9BACL|nr:DNA-directed RNA polymerase subunit beta [Sporolactobacillus terrae]QAA21538.1 DNA-directed RNA polymerase subunit beta [Sporolactobacillus terrae]QAA24510.1 DNA-directed RNA polymerase subunit beta [Sporolactobacillus terrae]
MEPNEKIHNKTNPPKTRKAARDQRKAVQKAERKTGKKRPTEEQKPLYNPFFAYKKRRFPIWQRLIALIALCCIALAAGAMLGYGGFGHRNPFAVFAPDTWQHIFDFFRTH